MCRTLRSLHICLIKTKVCWSSRLDQKARRPTEKMPCMSNEQFIPWWYPLPMAAGTEDTVLVLLLMTRRGRQWGHRFAPHLGCTSAFLWMIGWGWKMHLPSDLSFYIILLLLCFIYPPRPEKPTYVMWTLTVDQHVIFKCFQPLGLKMM